MTAPHDGLDDAALLRAHVAGDRDAFGELVRRHRDKMWAVAIRTLGDREEAADAVQDAFLSAYRAAGRFRGDSAVTTWLHRIVVNACIDRARRQQARPTVPLPEHETVQLLVPRASATPDTDLALAVQAALFRLSPEQRVPLVLLDMHGYTVAEIAAMLNVAEGTVKSRCARGRARLAGLLGYLRGADPDPAHGNRGPVGDVGVSGVLPSGADGTAGVEQAGQDRASQGGAL